MSRLEYTLCPENVCYILLTIQLQSILKWWVFNNFVLKILKHATRLAICHFSLALGPQMVLVITEGITKIEWSTNLATNQLMCGLWPIPASSAVAIWKACNSEIFLCDTIKCKVSARCSVWLCSKTSYDALRFPFFRYILILMIN